MHFLWVKIKKKKEKKPHKIYFKNAALKIRIWTFVLLTCVTGDSKE